MKIPAGSHQVQFGTTTITFELVYTERQTLAVHVYPDGTVEVHAPRDTAYGQVEQTVLRKGAWVLRQQREFATYPTAAPPPRRYVSGEAYRYLGRQYRLKVGQDRVERIVLTRGYLTVSVHNPTDTRHIRDMVNAWYLRQAKRVFAESLAACFPRVQHLGVSYPTLAVRTMKARWGSCSPAGTITLNPRLIQAPRSLIDYVILHELCHLKDLSHSPTFYALLSRVLPNWEKLRQQLNQFEFGPT